MMLIQVPPAEGVNLGSALAPDEYRALDCMRGTGSITPETAQKFGIIDLASTIKRLRALGYDIREYTNDPRIEPRVYAITVYSLYDEIDHIQAVINRLAGLCINDSIVGSKPQES